MAYRLEIDQTPETIGALELTSIARGYRVVDQLLKRAPVQLLDARACSPGKFFIVICGDVASVEEAMETGELEAAQALFGRLFIPNLAPEVVPAINREALPEPGESVGILECFSAVSVIEGADRGIKSASVALESVNLLQGLGGKAYAIFSGELTDVAAAMEAALSVVPPEMVVDTQVIPQVSRELITFLPGRG